MTRTPIARSSTVPDSVPGPIAPRDTAGRGWSGTWLVAALPLVACCGMHLLAAGAVVAGFALLGIVGAAVVAVAGVGAVLWWRQHRRSAGTATLRDRSDSR